MYLTNTLDIELIVDVGEYKIFFPANSAYTYEEAMELLMVPKALITCEVLQHKCEEAGIYYFAQKFYEPKPDLHIIP